MQLNPLFLRGEFKNKTSVDGKHWRISSFDVGQFSGTFHFSRERVNLGVSVISESTISLKKPNKCNDLGWKTFVKNLKL